MTQDSRAAAYEALLQFLYQTPIGLVQATLDGEITMINPMSAQLLMPLAPGGNLVNLFDVLAPLAPQLRGLVASHPGSDGVICESLRLALGEPEADGVAPKTLAVRLVKLDAGTLMASVSDVSFVVQQEQLRLATRLRAVTRIDSLTSMPNRAVVLERIENALENTRTDPGYLFAVMFVNGDRFSGINVTLGPAAGDDLLRPGEDGMAGAPARGGRVEGQRDLARRGELERVGEQVFEHLLEAFAVRADGARQPRVQRDGERQSLLISTLDDQIDDTAHARSQTERRQTQIRWLGVELRHVQEFVDQRQ